VTLFTADFSFLVEFSTIFHTALAAASTANMAMVLFNVIGTLLI
jgi:hypothetical protein